MAPKTRKHEKMNRYEAKGRVSDARIEANSLCKLLDTLGVEVHAQWPDLDEEARGLLGLALESADEVLRALGPMHKDSPSQEKT